VDLCFWLGAAAGLEVSLAAGTAAGADDLEALEVGNLRLVTVVAAAVLFYSG
jgi:hypothetical protein